jgi:flagellar basal body-associated protein FliL
MTTAIIIICILGVLGLAAIYWIAAAMIEEANGLGGGDDDAQAQAREDAEEDARILAEIEQWREGR